MCFELKIWANREFLADEGNHPFISFASYWFLCSVQSRWLLRLFFLNNTSPSMLSMHMVCRLGEQHQKHDLLNQNVRIMWKEPIKGFMTEVLIETSSMSRCVKLSFRCIMQSIWAYLFLSTSVSMENVWWDEWYTCHCRFQDCCCLQSRDCTIFFRMIDFLLKCGKR